MKIFKIIFFPFLILWWVLKAFFWIFTTQTKAEKKERARQRKNARARAATLEKKGKGETAAAERRRYGTFSKKKY